MRGLTATALKWIAVAAMVLDHIGYVFMTRMPYPLYLTLRCVGRTAFPVFCFCLVEGFFHTGNFRKYLTRIGIFALLSEVPFDLMTQKAFVDFSGSNVLVTFLIGLSVLKVCETVKERYAGRNIRTALWVLTVALGMGIAYFVRSDYSWQGILVVACMYFFRQKKWLMNVTVGISLCLSGSVYEIFALAALAPLYFYNGKKSLTGTNYTKFFFYAFYPLHLLLLGLLGICF